MSRILLLLFCILFSVAKSQNGFTTYTTNLSITGVLKFQTGLVIDNGGNKWIGFRTTGGITNAGLVKYDNTNWTLYNKTSSPAFPSDNVTALAKDNSGNIWIGCDSGLVKFDGVAFTTYNTAQGLPMKFVNCIEVVGNQIYVGTNKGLSRFDGVNFTNYNVAGNKLPNDTVKCIKSETSNLLWLGGRNHLVEFSINGAFVSSYIDHLISNNPGVINCVFIDAQNVKWLGTSNVGVLQYTNSIFTNVNSLYTIPGTIPSKITDIALGLNNGVVFKYKHSLTANYFGLIELASKNEIYTYVKSVNTFTNSGIGDNIENDGTSLVFTFAGPLVSYIVPNMFGTFNKLQYTLPFGVMGGNNVKSLDLNQIRASITNRSYLHGFENQNVGYQVPKGSGKYTTNGAVLWVEGIDNSNQLHGAAQVYSGVAGGDFWPGPLDTISGSIDTTTSWNYDKVWKVSYTDINTFVNAYNSGSVVATPDMLSWPAHGSGNNSRNLAPFVDHNGDGLYNPNDGDYPKIKGDQSLYFIYNDMLSVHGSSYTPMGIEVQGMAYVYGCPAILNGKNELAYTTFYDYKILNRSSNNYHNVNITLLCNKYITENGDFIGCNVSDNYGYIYHNDTTDEDGYTYKGYGAYPPTQGVAVIKGPVANLSDGIDNNNNGVIDELNEECKLNRFTNYYTGLVCIPGLNTEPYKASEFHNYMNGLWLDSTHVTCGNSGVGGITNANWMYSGDPNNVGVNTDPNNTCGYWVQQWPPRAPVMMLSSGPFSLNAGQMQEVEYAFVTSFDSSSTTNSNLLSVAKLKTDMQKVTAFYNQVNKPNCLQALTAGVSEVVKQNDIALFPNPSKSIITISSTIGGTVKINYEIVDVLGKVVIQNENTSSDKFTINISDLNSGIYFVRLHVNNSIMVKKFVKE